MAISRLLPRDPRRDALKSMVVRATSTLKSVDSLKRAATVVQQADPNPAMIDRLVGADSTAVKVALNGVATGAFGEGGAEFMSVGAVMAAGGIGTAVHVFTSASVILFYREALRNSGIDPAQLGRHALATSAAAARLASWSSADTAKAQLAGLLHNVGVGLLIWSAPDRYGRGKSPIAGTEVQLHEMETEVFGFDHQEAGALFLQQCGFGAGICEVAGTHHAESASGLAGIVRTADIAAHQMGCDMGFANALPGRLQATFESLGESKLSELASVITASTSNFARLRD